MNFNTTDDGRIENLNLVSNGKGESLLNLGWKKEVGGKNPNEVLIGKLNKKMDLKGPNAIKTLRIIVRDKRMRIEMLTEKGLAVEVAEAAAAAQKIAEKQAVEDDVSRDLKVAKDILASNSSESIFKHSKPASSQSAALPPPVEPTSPPRQTAFQRMAGQGGLELEEPAAPKKVKKRNPVETSNEALPLASKQPQVSNLPAMEEGQDRVTRWKKENSILLQEARKRLADFQASRGPVSITPPEPPLAWHLKKPKHLGTKFLRNKRSNKTLDNSAAVKPSRIKPKTGKGRNFLALEREFDRVKVKPEEEYPPYLKRKMAFMLKKNGYTVEEINSVLAESNFISQNNPAGEDNLIPPLEEFPPVRNIISAKDGSRPIHPSAGSEWLERFFLDRNFNLDEYQAKRHRERLNSEQSAPDLDWEPPSPSEKEFNFRLTRPEWGVLLTELSNAIGFTPQEITLYTLMLGGELTAQPNVALGLFSVLATAGMILTRDKTKQEFEAVSEWLKKDGVGKISRSMLLFPAQLLSGESRQAYTEALQQEPLKLLVGYSAGFFSAFIGQATLWASELIYRRANIATDLTMRLSRLLLVRVFIGMVLPRFGGMLVNQVVGSPDASGRRAVLIGARSGLLTLNYLAGLVNIGAAGGSAFGKIMNLINDLPAATESSSEPTATVTIAATSMSAEHLVTPTHIPLPHDTATAPPTVTPLIPIETLAPGHFLGHLGIPEIGFNAVTGQLDMSNPDLVQQFFHQLESLDFNQLANSFPKANDHWLRIDIDDDNRIDFLLSDRGNAYQRVGEGFCKVLLYDGTLAINQILTEAEVINQ